MFKVKNWSEYQPPLKSDRSVIWIKVYRKILDDYEWSNLSSDNKATLIELWLLASENNGKIKNFEEICFRLRRDKPFIARQLKQLSNFIVQVGNEPETERKQLVSLEKSKSKRESKSRVEVIQHGQVEVITKAENEFLEFWNLYPKKKKKKEALSAWLKVLPPIQPVLNAIGWQKQQQDWVKEDGKFIPHPATYINGHRWEDEPDEDLINF
jgi:hypothetical protein